MTHTAVMNWEPDGVVAKVLGFPSQGDAEAHVVAFSDRFPNAFVVPTPAFPEDQWRVQSGQIVDAGPPPTYPTEESAIAAMIAWCEEAEAIITGPVSRGEQDSWPAKSAEARAWQAVHDHNTANPGDVQSYPDTPILDAELSLTQTMGETMEELVGRVIARSDGITRITGLIAGLRRTTKAALAAEPDPANYQAILQAAQAQAITLAADEGFTLEP
ncbi:MAG: hypothetical protein AAGI03_04275 [Pseudomonadota bacterium]